MGSLARAVTLTSLLVAATLSSACEEDALVASGGFDPTQCPDDDPQCNDRNRDKLDAGEAPWLDSGVVPDAGVAPVDAGVAETDAGVVDPDSGVAPDSGVEIDAGVPPEFLIVAGSYRTHYKMDLSRYLLGLSNIAEPLDFLDQAIAGNVNTGFPPLDALVRDIIARYVPPWVGTVIGVLNSLANFFEEVEARGVLNLAQPLPTGNVSPVSANETWNTLTVKIIDNCPRGRQDPNYPACAEQMIPIATPPTPIGAVDIGVDPRPFMGVLQPGRPRAPIRFDDREVRMEMTKLIRVVADLAISLGTNGQVPSLQVALERAIDCVQLEAETERLATSIGLSARLARAAAAGVRAVCDQEKQNVITRIIGGIEGIGIGWEALEFDMIGDAHDTNGNHRPETLQVHTVPDTLDGRFRLVVGTRFDGTWEGISLNP